MRKELAAAVKDLDAARQMLADNPKSNKAMMTVVDAEDNYILERALHRALARVA
jgi:hypothetical protein